MSSDGVITEGHLPEAVQNRIELVMTMLLLLHTSCSCLHHLIRFPEEVFYKRSLVAAVAQVNSSVGCKPKLYRTITKRHMCFMGLSFILLSCTHTHGDAIIAPNDEGA